MAGAKDLDSKQITESNLQDSKDSIKLTKNIESKEIKLAQNLESKKILMNSQDSKENIDSKDSTNSITNIESRFKDSNISLDSIKLAMNTDSKDSTKLSKITESKHIKLAQNLESSNIDSIKSTKYLESKKQDSILLAQDDTLIDSSTTDSKEKTESNLQDSKAITESSSQDSNKATKTYNLEKVTTIMSNARSQREIFEMNDNIASVSGESLEKLNIQNTQDLQKTFSGLYITQEGQVGNPRITLRGMTSGYKYTPNVRIYIDDVPQDSMFINQELLDVYSVELFKGMSGTMYGENAQSGILSINSNIASNKTRVSASFTLGTLDRILSASASGALIKDRLYAKISVKSNDYLGQVRDAQTGWLANTTNSKLARISLLYDNERFFLGSDYYLDKGVYRDSVYLSDAEKESNGDIYHDYGTAGIREGNRTTQTFALKGGYIWDNFSLKNVLSYQDKALPDTFAQTIWEENSKTLTNELKGTQIYNNGSTSLYGIYFSYNNFDFNVIKENTQRFNDKNNRQNFSFALFTDHKILLPANFDLSIGLRYSYYKNFIDYTKGAASVGTNNAPATPSFSNNVDSNQFSPRIALSYTLLDSHKIYTSFARGFKEGGFTHFVAYALNNVLPYKPETNYSAEIGYKGMFWNDRIYINAAYFFNYVIDRQDYVNTGAVNATTNAPIRTINNIGDMISQGFDFEGKLQFLESSFFMLNFSYVNARYVKYVNPFGVAQTLPGNRVQYLPDFNLNASIDSKIWGNNFVKLYFNTLVSFKSRIYFNAGGATPFSQEPYWLWDIGARAEFKGGISLSLRVENVLNTKYDLYGYVGFGGAGNQHYIGRLRNYSATLSYKF